MGPAHGCQIFVLHPGPVLRQHGLGAHGLLPTELDAQLLVTLWNLSPAGFAWAVPAIDEAWPWTIGWRRIGVRIQILDLWMGHFSPALEF